MLFQIIASIILQRFVIFWGFYRILVTSLIFRCCQRHSPGEELIKLRRKLFLNASVLYG